MLNWELPLWLMQYGRSGKGWLWSLIHKGIAASALVSLITCRRVSQVPCHEDTQSGLWRSLLGEEPPASTNLPACEWMTSEADLPAPVKPSGDHNPFDRRLKPHKRAKLENPIELLLNSWLIEILKDNKLLFSADKFVIICYIANYWYLIGYPSTPGKQA
jgi:hypothetical protein